MKPKQSPLTFISLPPQLDCKLQRLIDSLSKLFQTQLIIQPYWSLTGFFSGLILSLFFFFKKTELLAWGFILKSPYFKSSMGGKGFAFCKWLWIYDLFNHSAHFIPNCCLLAVSADFLPQPVSPTDWPISPFSANLPTGTLTLHECRCLQRKNINRGCNISLMGCA